MRILFLPVNVASMQPITAHALNQIEGVEAKCLTYFEHKFLEFNETVIYCPRTSKIINPIKWVKTKLNYRSQIKELVQWADVLHYVAGPGLKSFEDLKWASQWNKKIFIEFIGSDIRDPKILKPINKYYNAVFDKGYEYAKQESGSYKTQIQNNFSSFGAIPLVNPEMQIFLNQKNFKKFYQIYLRIDVNNFTPYYPKIENKKPVIVHSPSALIAKGSKVILPIIEHLQKKYDFEFILIHNKPRSEVLKLIQNSDIFIDQIILGTYAMAAMEAMSYGKPTISYIMKEVFENGLPLDCPIVNANPDTLEEKLIELITNPILRHEIGKKSRAYVEKYHDVEKISKKLLEIYKS
jgi:hypothetical protein